MKTKIYESEVEDITANNIDSANNGKIDDEAIEKVENICIEQSNKASANLRTLAFGSAGICWFFKSDKVTFPENIIIAMSFVATYFIFDTMQYYIAYCKYADIDKCLRCGGSDIQDLKRKLSKINTASTVFFHFKFVFLFLSYCLIFLELIDRAFNIKQ